MNKVTFSEKSDKYTTQQLIAQCITLANQSEFKKIESKLDKLKPFMIHKVISNLCSNGNYHAAQELLSRSQKIYSPVEYTRATRRLFGAKKKHDENLRQSQLNSDYKFIRLEPLEKINSTKISIKDFSLEEVSFQNPHVYHLRSGKQENLNQGFDQLGGLLKTEFDQLYCNEQWDKPIYNVSKHFLYTIPQSFFCDESLIYLGDEKPKYISQLTDTKVKWSSCCLLKNVMQVSDIACLLPITRAKFSYYHGLCDTLVTLDFYLKLGLTCPIIVSDGCLNLARTIANYLGIPSEKFLSLSEIQGEKIFKLVLAIVRSPNNNFDCNGAIFYRNIIRKLMDSTQEPLTNNFQNHKIYISRRLNNKRSLLNEEEIENLLKERGFSIHHMEKYSFEEQVFIMKNAKIIVSPHGAGLTNMMFCGNEATIVEFIMDQYPNKLFYDLSLACRFKYFPILGQCIDANYDNGDKGFKWIVNVNKLQQVLNKIV